MIFSAKKLPQRNDPAGSGAYASRRAGGTRPHKGVDFTVPPGDYVLSPVGGRVTALGLCYSDTQEYRYVQIESASRGPAGLRPYRHRLFYVQPLYSLAVGATVTRWQPIGTAQDITLRYPGQGMLPHIHYEILTLEGEAQDPFNFPPALENV